MWDILTGLRRDVFVVFVTSSARPLYVFVCGLELMYSNKNEETFGTKNNMFELKMISSFFKKSYTSFYIQRTWIIAMFLNRGAGSAGV